MKPVWKGFSALLQGKGKTPPRLRKPDLPADSQRFAPYKARDRPVSGFAGEGGE